MVTIMSSAVQVLSPPTSPTVSRRISLTGSTSSRPRHHDLDRFTDDTEHAFESALTPETLQIISAALQDRFRQACQHHPLSFLPSFCHTLPSGHERGSALALDVGGSTLRVALVELRGRGGRGDLMVEQLRRDFVIDDSVRRLSGRSFFAWMAERVHETFQGHLDRVQGPSQLPIGLSWSFPVEYATHPMSP